MNEETILKFIFFIVLFMLSIIIIGELIHIETIIFQIILVFSAIIFVFSIFIAILRED